MPSVELDALLGQTVPQRCPRLRQHFTLRVGTPPRDRSRAAATLVLGVDQAQVEMPER